MKTHDCNKCSVLNELNKQICSQNQMIVKQNIIIRLLKSINSYTDKWGRLNEKYIRN